MVVAGSVVTKAVVPFGLVYGNTALLAGLVCACGRRWIRIRNTFMLSHGDLYDRRL
ncbi:hypothetical protein C5S53_13405 [Methanophagales archaeon]|nr:hypothetical protein C5S53_13405 [Methanophagales archaeon]